LSSWPVRMMARAQAPAANRAAGLAPRPRQVRATRARRTGGQHRAERVETWSRELPVNSRPGQAGRLAQASPEWRAPAVMPERVKPARTLVAAGKVAAGKVAAGKVAAGKVAAGKVAAGKVAPRALRGMAVQVAARRSLARVARQGRVSCILARALLV